MGALVAVRLLELQVLAQADLPAEVDPFRGWVAVPVAVLVAVPVAVLVAVLAFARS